MPWFKRHIICPLATFERKQIYETNQAGGTKIRSPASAETDICFGPETLESLWPALWAETKVSVSVLEGLLILVPPPWLVSFFCF